MEKPCRSVSALRRAMNRLHLLYDKDCSASVSTRACSLEARSGPYRRDAIKEEARQTGHSPSTRRSQQASCSSLVSATFIEKAGRSRLVPDNILGLSRLPQGIVKRTRSYLVVTTAILSPFGRHCAEISVGVAVIRPPRDIVLILPFLVCQQLSTTLRSSSKMSGAMAPSSGSSIIRILLFLFLLPAVFAQFGGFFQGGFPFGGGHQQEAQRRPDRQYKGWTEMEAGEPNA